jgi:plasmid stabilization system protein ParE
VRGRLSIAFTQSAVTDLEQILAWPAEQGVPEVGKRLVAEVIRQVERLGRFPESGRVVLEFGISLLREIILPPLRIAYRIDEDRIRVIRVWRSERRLDLPDV